MDESLRIYEDWDFAIRLASRFRFAACRSALVEHRVHAEGLHCSAPSDHLRIMIRVLHKALNLCEHSMVPDKPATKRRIESFLRLLQAREALLHGDLARARLLVYAGIRRNIWRSMCYDLLVRLWVPSLCLQPPPLYDGIMIGPLALPYYLLRGMCGKRFRCWLR